MTTWTPASPDPANSWTEENSAARAFDPYGFANSPSFDTGSSSGVWTAESAPSTTWTAE